MAKGLVVVDAWKVLYRHDVKDHPTLQDEVASFGKFLNQVCKIERDKGTQIIHSASHRLMHGGIMDEIEVFSEDRVMGEDGNTTWAELRESIDELYWCGFHFGRCIHEQARIAVGNEAKIVTNLSLLFPVDSWKEMFASWPTFNYYLWSQNGFEEVNIS